MAMWLSLKWTLVIFVLTTILNVLSKPIEIMFLHMSHTGSHALCESIVPIACMQATCSEQNDYEFQNFYYDTSTSDARFAMVLVFYHFVRGLGPYRLQILEPPEKRRFLVLFRRNILEWSLSEYCKMNTCEWESTDPQFEFENLNSVEKKTEKHVYSADILNQTYEKLYHRWEEQVKIADQLREKGSYVAFAFYEEYQKDHDGYADKILQWAENPILYDINAKIEMPQSCLERRNLTIDYADSDGEGHNYRGVKKVHSPDISEWVENHEELKQFANRNFKHFKSTLEDYARFTFIS